MAVAVMFDSEDFCGFITVSDADSLMMADNADIGAKAPANWYTIARV